jgi:hypothetical protein
MNNKYWNYWCNSLQEADCVMSLKVTLLQTYELFSKHYTAVLTSMQVVETLCYDHKHSNLLFLCV